MQSPRLEESWGIDFWSSYCGKDESLDNWFQGWELLKPLLCISMLQWWWMLFSSAQIQYLYLLTSSPISWRCYLQIWEHIYEMGIFILHKYVFNIHSLFLLCCCWIFLSFGLMQKLSRFISHGTKPLVQWILKNVQVEHWESNHTPNLIFFPFFQHFSFGLLL